MFFICGDNHTFALSITDDGTHTNGGTELGDGVRGHYNNDTVGGILTFVPNTNGTLYYYCAKALHNNMGGEITVG